MLLQEGFSFTDISVMSFADIDDWSNVIYSDRIEQRLERQEDLLYARPMDKKSAMRANKNREMLKQHSDIAMGLKEKKPDYRKVWAGKFK